MFFCESYSHDLKNVTRNEDKYVFINARLYILYIYIYIYIYSVFVLIHRNTSYKSNAQISIH